MTYVLHEGYRMGQKTIIQTAIALGLLVATCLAYGLYSAYESHKELMAMPPGELPGQVLVFSAPG